MKDFVKFCLAIACGALLGYTAYLIYEKFFKGGCCCGRSKDLDEEEEEVSFGERIKRAAQRQLEKIN